MKTEDYPLREQYLRFNRLFFNNELPEDLRLGVGNLANVTSRGALGVFRHPYPVDGVVNKDLCIIELDNRYDYKKEGLDGILLHEMVHAYMFLVVKDFRGGEHDSHHAEFWAKLEEVADGARDFGIEVPSTDYSGTMLKHAEGKLRSNMTLAVFRFKEDGPDFMRFAYMLPGVFDDIVNDFQFKVATTIADKNSAFRTKGQRTVTTLAHPGSRFYGEFIDSNINGFNKIDWDTGVDIYRTSDKELAALFDTYKITQSQRFLDDKKWVTDKPGIKVQGLKRASPKSKEWVPHMYDVWNNPTVFGMIKRAMKRAQGKATVKADGVYVGRDLIHAPPIKAINQPTQTTTQSSMRQGAERQAWAVKFTDRITTYGVGNSGTMDKEDSRYFATLEQAAANVKEGGGPLRRVLVDSAYIALTMISKDGTRSQREVANAALKSVAAISYYTNNLPFSDLTGGKPEGQMDFDDFANELASTYWLTTLFGGNNPFLTSTNMPHDDNYRNFTVALYVFGQYEAQLPNAYKDAAMDILARIAATVISKEGSVLDKSLQTPVVPNLDDTMRAELSTDVNDEDRSYERKSYSEMTAVEKQQVLEDALLSGAEVQKFMDSYRDLPLDELPEVYQKAFGGYMWYLGTFHAPSVAEVNSESSLVNKVPIGLQGYWDKLWTNFKPGEEVPANQFGSDSESGSFEMWKRRFLLRRRNQFTNLQSMVRQNDRSMNFPFLPKFAGEALTGDERTVLLMFKDDPEWVVYVQDIRGKAPQVAADFLRNTLDKLIARGLLMQGFQGPREFVKLTQAGLDWLKENATALENAPVNTVQTQQPKSDLPPGWTEATPGGAATNKDPENGGIIDKVIKTGKWFIIFNRDGVGEDEQFATRKEAFDAFFRILEEEDAARSSKPTKKDEEPPKAKAPDKPEAPERSVKAPKVREADGKTTFNLKLGVNEKTKKLMIVPVETATTNNIGLVRKREAKPIAAFLNYVFAHELAEITKKIKAKQRKGAARDLANIANRIRPYLVASGKEATPFPGKLAAYVTKDWGAGLPGQKAFWQFLQGKKTTRIKLYHNVEKLASLAGILPESGHEDDEEASFDFSQFEVAAEGVYVGVKFSKRTQRQIEHWIAVNLIQNPITDFTKMHSTLVYSEKPLSEPWEPVDYMLTGSGLLVSPDTFKLEVWEDGDHKVLVLKYDSPIMQERFDLSQDLGAVWKYPTFNPHITLSYNCGDIDVSKLPTPEFPLYITHEYADVLRKKWAETALPN
jgi:hypothetical protein